MERIRILFADDHPIFRQIAIDFLHDHEDLQVVGTACTGDMALTRARELQPQIVLLDLRMPGPTWQETIPRLRSLLPDAGIIVLTLHDGNGYRQAVLTAGAHDFVSKSIISTELLPAIRRVASGPAATLVEQSALKQQCH